LRFLLDEHLPTGLAKLMSELGSDALRSAWPQLMEKLKSGDPVVELRP
jgi:hypothetical protein